MSCIVASFIRVLLLLSCKFFGETGFSSVQLLWSSGGLKTCLHLCCELNTTGSEEPPLKPINELNNTTISRMRAYLKPVHQLLSSVLTLK